MARVAGSLLSWLGRGVGLVPLGRLGGVEEPCRFLGHLF